MICNRCQFQTADGANFCANCGMPFNPQAFRPYQPPQQQYSPGNPYANEANQDFDKSQRALLILGLVSFGVNIFWAGFSFLMRLIGYRYYENFSFFIKPLSIATGVMVVFLCFLLAKKQGTKTILLVLFIVATLIEIVQVYLPGFLGGRY
jgi:hypothetical protein